MPNQSGVWTLSQQFQARGQGLWPAPPGAPTIGTATAGSNLCASVTFTAPACTGYPAGVTGYTVTSTPGCITKTGASSPLVVTGLTNGTSYTFKVKATNATGTGSCSAASNSITASSGGSQSYTTPGTYSWVAPAGVTKVSVVAIGGGGAGGSWGIVCCPCFGSFYRGGPGGGGGALGYANNISVAPGCSYTVVVGAGSVSANCSGGKSWFLSQPNYYVNGGVGGGVGGSGGTVGPAMTGGSGGCGGGFVYFGCLSSTRGGGGGGAGGYSGKGGAGGAGTPCAGAGSGAPGATDSGAGGGGGAGVMAGFGGGGVGILGKGATGGSSTSGGKGGSGGATATTSSGASYGAGGGGGTYNQTYGPGANGAVRIIWPGDTRQFPSTNAGNP